jgi:hypothetical protein
MGGRQPDPKQETTTKMSPEQQMLFQTVFPTIQKYAATVPERYQGSTVAGFTPEQAQGQEMALGAVPNINQLGTNAAKANDFYTSGAIWDPKSNPNLQGAIDASVRPVYQNLTEKALPAIRGDAVTSGNFGSSRQGIVEAQTARDAGTTAGDIASKIAQGQYATNLEAQQKAIGMTPAIQAMQTAGARTTSGVGDIRQAMNQANINAGVNAFNFDQYAPFMNAKDILSIMQGIPGATTVTTANTPRPNPWMQAAGAGLGALPLLMMM